MHSAVCIHEADDPRWACRSATRDGWTIVAELKCAEAGGGGYLSSLDLPRGSGAVGGHDTTQEIPLGCCGEEGHREDLSAPFDCEHAASCRIRCAWILLFDHWVPPCYLLVEGVSWIVMVVVVRADQVSKAWDCRKIIFCESEEERERGRDGGCWGYVDVGRVSMLGAAITCHRNFKPMQGTWNVLYSASKSF